MGIFEFPYVKIFLSDKFFAISKVIAASSCGIKSFKLRIQSNNIVIPNIIMIFGFFQKISYFLAWINSYN